MDQKTTIEKLSEDLHAIEVNARIARRQLKGLEKDDIHLCYDLCTRMASILETSQRAVKLLTVEFPHMRRRSRQKARSTTVVDDEDWE